MKKIFLIIFIIFITTLNANAVDTSVIKSNIIKQSVALGVEPSIMLGIAKMESGFNQNARSRSGAVGVFQVLPSTARRMGYNAYSLNDNIKCGILYYKSLYKTFKSEKLALAAYNAGAAKVKKYKSIPPYKETRCFVYNVMKASKEYKLALAKSTKPQKTVQTSKPKIATAHNKNTPTKIAVQKQAKTTKAPENKIIAQQPIQKESNKRKLLAPIPKFIATKAPIPGDITDETIIKLPDIVYINTDEKVSLDTTNIEIYSDEKSSDDFYKFEYNDTNCFE